MPKVTLEFTLPEEKEELNIAQHGHNYYVALSEFAEFLRNKEKYGEPSTTWEQVKHDFWQIMNEYEVSIL